MKRFLHKFRRPSAARGRVFQRFAKKLGLVYFGSVDQHHDEHDVIRGLTVSTTHKDRHYAVGSFDGYDVSIVDRSDSVRHRDTPASEHSWVIMRIDLETDDTIPHLFLHPLGHTPKAYETFFQAFHHLQPVNTMLRDDHTVEFHNRYDLYALSSRTLELEDIFTPTVTQQIATRLWPYAVEVFENKLYIYTTGEAIHESQLNTALELGLWLAHIFDKQD